MAEITMKMAPPLDDFQRLAADQAYRSGLTAVDPQELGRLRQIEALTTAITADSLSPWGASAYEDHWQCDYCQGRCDDMGDEPGDHGHTEDCPWWRLRQILHNLQAYSN